MSQPRHCLDHQHSRIHRLHKIFVRDHFVGFECQLSDICRDQQEDRSGAGFFNDPPRSRFVTCIFTSANEGAIRRAVCNAVRTLDSASTMQFCWLNRESDAAMELVSSRTISTCGGDGIGFGFLGYRRNVSQSTNLTENKAACYTRAIQNSFERRRTNHDDKALKNVEIHSRCKGRRWFSP